MKLIEPKKRYLYKKMILMWKRAKTRIPKPKFHVCLYTVDDAIIKIQAPYFNDGGK